MSITATTLKRLAALKLPAKAFQEVLSILADVQASEEGRKQRDRDRKKPENSMEIPRNKTGISMGNSAPETPSPSPAAPASPSPPITPLTPSPSPPPSSTPSPSLRSGTERAFEEFWKLYPHKVGKQAALKAFTRIAKSGAVIFEKLMAGLESYTRKTDDRPWCNPATWLNEGRWDDQPAPEVPRNGQGKSLLAAADRQLEELGGMEAARAYVPGSAGPQSPSLDFGPQPPSVRRLSSG